MLVLKLAALTCAFYLSVAVLIEATILGLTHLMGGIGFFAPRPKLVAGIFFGAVWLGSFLFAWRIVVTPIFARIPK
jgi:hypothetical protein